MEGIFVISLIFNFALIFISINLYLKLDEKSYLHKVVSNKYKQLNQYTSELEKDHEMGKIAIEKANSIRDDAIHKCDVETALHLNSINSNKVLLRFYNNGVFYDTQNDTIVVVDNLERIGDL
jgi:nitrogen fixation protein FixH